MTFIFGFRKHCENVVFGLFERNLKKENNSEKKILLISRISVGE